MVVNAGLGMGLTAYQAEMHARKALEYSLGKGREGSSRLMRRRRFRAPGPGAAASVQHDIL